MVDAGLATAVVIAAFLPPILFAAYVRNQERTRREPWSVLLTVFVFGAIVSVLVALALESLFGVPDREYQLLKGQFTVPSIVILVVVIAPLAEEFAKGLGVRAAKRFLVEEEDGIIYGAAAGFGFSATENLFYELAALHEGGPGAYYVTALVRTFTGCFLHATASGLVGYGLGKAWRTHRNLLDAAPYFAMAVLLHAAFNLLAVLQIGLAFAMVIIIAFLGMRYTVQRIRRFDSAPTFRSSRGSP